MAKVIYAEPSEKFRNAWERFNAEHSLQKREYVCCGLLWLMSLTHEDREDAIRAYKEWEAKADAGLPKAHGGL